ncbi:MAG: glycosyltransferase family 87 protein [Pseudolabrys sp.]
MAVTEFSAQPAQSPARLIGVIGLSLALGYAVLLAGVTLQGYWLIDSHGQPIASDFVNVWAAGKLALEGHAPFAYEWGIHRAAEVMAIGHEFDGYYGWHYPPPFFFAAAALATLPYTVAALAWLAATLPLYAAVVRMIVGARVGILLAIGFPAALWNTVAGQNGFLTAALIGATLSFLERRPVAAGVCLGLLSYKPQFGLLFPIALIAGRCWRTIAAAAATVVAMIAVSILAFGMASWQAFFDWMPVTSHVVLGEGRADWNRLQSIFGFIRSHGGSETFAWSAQIVLAVALAAAVAWLWRGQRPFALKAAGLVAASLLATPYVYTYDLVILAIPVAFLVRLGLTQGFMPGEDIGLLVAALSLLCFPYQAAHIGLAVVTVVAVLTVRHILSPRAHASAAQSVGA